MIPSDLWESVKKRFGTSEGKHSVKEKDFYADKFALWVDMRTHPDNGIHGGGLALNNTQDGVKLEIKRKQSGSGTITCHMFVVADAMMEIMNSGLRSIKY